MTMRGTMRCVGMWVVLAAVGGCYETPVPSAVDDAQMREEIAPPPDATGGDATMDATVDAPTEAAAPSDAMDADASVPDADAPSPDADVPEPDADVPEPDATVDAAGPCVSPLVVESQSLAGDLASVALGVGYNPVTSDLTTTCVEVARDGDACSGGRRETFEMQFVQESSRLKESLGLRANASYNSGLYSGQASASFFRSSEVRSDSAYLVLDVRVVFEPQTLPAARLTEAAIARLRADPAGFVATCGTHYVASVRRGGLFRAVYVFNSLSTNDRMALGASFGAGGGTWAASGEFSSAIERATSRYETRLFVLRSGGRFEPVGLTPRELINEARNFAASPDGGAGVVSCATATPVEVEMRPYYATVNIPPGARYPDLRRQVTELELTASTHDHVRVLRNDLQARLGRPSRLSLPECAADLGAITARQRDIDAFFRAVDAKRLACQTIDACGASAACLASLPTVDLALPLLRDPGRCGPACTDGASSTFESDEYGYCTRCTWRWPGTRTTGGERDVADIVRSDCRYMRPGALTTVQIRGRVGPPPCSTQPVFYANLSTRATSGMLSSSCASISAPCATYFRDMRSGGEPFAMRQEALVDHRALPTSVAASIYQHEGWGAGCGGLSLSDITVDFCDPDRRRSGCALPP